nr:MAG TPA: hypothetical protein [Podoviridae sp. ctK5Q1]
MLYLSCLLSLSSLLCLSLGWLLIHLICLAY